MSSIQIRAFTVLARPTVEGDRRVKFIASTPAVDSHGTRIHPSGCRLSRFKLAGQLPFLWNHKRDGEPEDVLGRVVAVEVKPDAVIVTVEFDVADNPKAANLLRRVRRGEIRGCSVGFHSLHEKPAADGVVDILEWELCELSLVPIGSNAEALALRGLRGGFTLSATNRNVTRLEVATILVRRSSDGHQLWGKRRDSGLYTTPGGKLAPGEDPVVGACRELYEEAGIRVGTSVHPTDPTALERLGVVDLSPRLRVHCFTVTVPAETQPNSANDPDREVERWDWLPRMPETAQLHARPNALTLIGARCGGPNQHSSGLLCKPTAARTPALDLATKPTQPDSRGPRNMNPADILSKLGLQEGAAPDAIAEALIKYLSGSPDAAEAKALVVGMLSMLAPAPSSSSASDGMAAAAAEAMGDELRKAQARIAELEGEKAKADQPSAEQRADVAIKDGRWPVGQRAVLVEQYKANKTPFLFAPKSFSTRGVNFTSGGNPTDATPATVAPRFGTDDKKTLTPLETGIVSLAKRAGLNLDERKFAAAKR